MNLKCSTCIQPQKWHNDFSSFPRQTIQNHSSPSLWSNWRSWSWMVLWRPKRPSRSNTPQRCPFHHRALECQSQDIPGVISKFGFGVQNEAGQRLIVLQREYTSHSNFPFPTIQWTTLQMVNTEIRLIIFFCSQRWRGSIQSAKTSSGAGCGSDHQLCIAKFRLELKKVGETTRPFRYDLN